MKGILVRLTLRTLLAYLDDTLEPLEIKTIGQKVAESETAQELISRIKQVTRRRRITTPPATGPNSFDPNVVAEYLDNGLTSDQVAELEKICLESDVHLAEVASCHQILTLVLGEPAAVPPTAKERMYGLVRGREAIPFRRAAAAVGDAASPTSADADADEMYLLGLPFYRRGSWLRWALPVAAVVFFTVVAVALWQSIQPGTPVAQKSNGRSQEKQRNQEVAENSGKAPAQPEKGANGENNARSHAERGNEGTKPFETVNKPPSNPPDQRQSNEPKTSAAQSELKTETPPSTKEPNKAPDKTPVVATTDRLAPPSKERVEVGQYYIPDYPPGHSLLVQRKDEKSGWSRLGPGTRVSSGDQLVSLPGYASEVRLDSGIHLLLRGNLPEFAPSDPELAKILYPLQDSALVLHKPKNTDADLTLQRGRLFLSNHKGNETPPLLVRLRFENKVWDLTLHPQAEVIVDLIKSRYAGEPLAVLHLNLLEGNAGIALEGEKYPDLSVPGRAGFSWNSLDPSKFDSRKVSKKDVEFGLREVFFKKPALTTDAAKKMDLALKAIKDRMIVDKDPLTVFREVLYNTNQFFEHQLALYCLAALDEVKELFDVLGAADQIHAPDRYTAIIALYRWLDHGRDQEKKLFDPETKNGLLVSGLGYTRSEAERIMELLHNPTADQILNSKDYYMDLAKDLASEKVAIAELARWRLSLLAIGMCKLDMPKLKAFNAARPSGERRAAMQEVLEKINEGRLPPPDPSKPRPPGTKGGSATNPNK
ncbi:MAG: hypothetical protein ACYC3I_19155 [Gemmataceae bacterium]